MRAQTQTAPSEIVAARMPAAVDAAPALDDPQWERGGLPGSNHFVNLTRRRTAGMTTRAYLLYDDHNLYLAFRCEQRGIPIVATQAANDVGFGHDDFVGVGIDTSGNGSQVYFFETTPRGVRYEQASESNRYRPAWSATGRLEAGGWSAQMTIPLAALKFHAGAQTAWRIDVFRAVSALNEHFTWAFDPLMIDGPVGNGWPAFTDARFWPRLTGLHFAPIKVAAEPSLDIYGLGAAGADHASFVAPDGSIIREHARNAGLDIAYPVTETTTLVAAVTPDFSNVEIDQQTIAPQEFPRQLKEYRPFFAQGASFISANPYPPGSYAAPGNLLFNTPSIGAFDRGVKIEGTAGKAAFGAMSFSGYDTEDAVSFDDAAYGYNFTLPDHTFLYWSDGVFAHHSDVTDATTEFGFAGRNNVSGLVWQADGAFEQRADTRRTFNSSENAFLAVHKPNYQLEMNYCDFSPTYGPVDGFTAAADLRGPGFSAVMNGASLGAKNVSLEVDGDRYLDGSGAVHQADTTIVLTAALKDGWSIDSLGSQTGLLRAYDVPSGPGCSGPARSTSDYSGGPCYRDGKTSRFDLFTAALGYREGTSVPSTFSYAQGPFGSAYVHQFTTTASRPLGARFSLGFEYDGTAERALADGALDSQWLRRVSLGYSLGADENLTLAVRAINGAGGYAVPGVDLAAAFHRRYAGGNDLYVNFGTPSASRTLHRVLVKYVLHLGPLRS